MSVELLAEIVRLLAEGEPEVHPAHQILRIESEALQVPAGAAARVRQWRTEGELRAAASLWSKYLFRLLLPPMVLAQCRTGRALVPAGTLVLARGLPVRWAELKLVSGPEHPLTYLEPWVRALTQSCGLRPRVLWNNAGNLLEVLLQRLPEQVPGLGRAPRERVTHWLDTPHWDGGRNPLFRPVVYQDGLRLRRVCCLRYRLPDIDYCSTCPCPKRG
jgi:ferric iron reductase protein FhuF